MREQHQKRIQSKDDEWGIIGLDQKRIEMLDIYNGGYCLVKKECESII